MLFYIGIMGVVIAVTYIMSNVPPYPLLEEIENTNTNTIIVVLGSNEQYMLKDRMTTAIHMTKNMTGSITWFLSGGIKNNNGTHKYEECESTKMLALLDSNKKEQIILDTTSRNTAENFANLKYWLNVNHDRYTHITIVTSAFHYSRANTIFNEIIGPVDMEVNWGLGSLSCTTCWTDERLHIRNISKDITSAMLIYQIKMNSK